MTTTRMRIATAVTAAALLAGGTTALAAATAMGRHGSGAGTCATSGSQARWGGGGTGMGRGAARAGTVAVPTGALTPTERATLVRMRQEEKLARDVYLKLAESSGLQIFARIARSEQNHMDRVGALLTAHGVADPVAGMARGEFADPAFTALYTQLVASGAKSDAAAVAVGLRIERLDIADLNAGLRTVTRPDVKRVLTNLRTGSSHHLAAFTAMS